MTETPALDNLLRAAEQAYRMDNLQAKQAYRDNLAAIETRLVNIEQAVINQTLLLERIGVQLAQLRTVLHA